MTFHVVKLVDPIQIVLSPGAFPDGVSDGDILRWNAGTSTWDVVLANTSFVQNAATTGEYRVTNIRMDADKKLLITYDDTPL
jgi:hypothetical protein